MIIVRLQGGLGNQLFQYAFGYAMSRRYDVPLVLDASLYSLKNFGTDTPREYKLDNFNIKADVRDRPIGLAGRLLSSRYFRGILGISQKPGFKLPINLIEERSMAYEERPYFPPSTYYSGFFQSERYFKEFESEIRKQLTLSKAASPEFESFRRLIETANESRISVAIHIRRGDFLTHPDSLKNIGFAPLDYFEKAISFFENKFPNVSFFVFSDDVEWAKTNIAASSPIIYVSNPALSDCEELMLMSYCGHNIISNSTFSWWSAWLNKNKNKIVVRPNRWFNNPSWSSKDLLPDSWISM